MEFQEAAMVLQLTEGRFSVEVASDEFRVILLIAHRGTPLQLDQADSPLLGMSATLLRRLTDKIRTKADGKNCRVEMVFEQ